MKAQLEIDRLNKRIIKLEEALREIVMVMPKKKPAIIDIMNDPDYDGDAINDYCSGQIDDAYDLGRRISEWESGEIALEALKEGY